MPRNACMIVYARYRFDTRVRREAEALVSHGFKVTVLSLKEESKKKRFCFEGVNVIELDHSKYRGSNLLLYLLSYSLFMLRAMIWCTVLFFKRQTDVVHVHNMPNYIVFAALIPRLFGKKVVLDLHDTLPETYAGKFDSAKSLFYRSLCLEESICCAFAHKLICVNQMQKDAVVARGVRDDKIEIVMNVPDQKIFRPNRKKWDTDSGETTFDIVYHGTVVKRLGIDLAIESVARLRKVIPEITFNVIGTGDDLDRCLEFRDKMDAQDFVYFSEKIFPVDEIPAIISGMDVGIVPNRRSVAADLMLPVKMMEYIAMEIPVIVPRMKAIEHYFTDDMVYFYEPENVESMMDAMKELHDQKAKRREMTVNAAEFIKKYGWGNHQKVLVDMYETMTG